IRDGRLEHPRHHRLSGVYADGVSRGDGARVGRGVAGPRAETARGPRGQRDRAGHRAPDRRGLSVLAIARARVAERDRAGVLRPLRSEVRPPAASLTVSPTPPATDALEKATA